MRKAQYDEESGNLTANCTKALHIKTGKGPGKSFGNCKALSKIEFDNYQDAYAYYEEGKNLQHPWNWAATAGNNGAPLDPGTEIPMICPDCPGATANTTRR